MPNIEYTDDYCMYEIGIRKLLDELQEYLVSMDTEHVQTWSPHYADDYYHLLNNLIRNNDGHCYLAVGNGEVIGFIAGYVEPKDQEDVISNRCPKRGVVSDLIVTSQFQNFRVGQSLMTRMERYFAEIGCEFIAINVFSPNEKWYSFYANAGYRPRNIEMYKRIKSGD